MKVNEERLQLGLDALRSGSYTQGKDHLCSITPIGHRQYCCLGVLTDVAIKNGVGGVTEHPGVEYVAYGDVNQSYAETALLPPTVAEWYGFEGQGPSLATEEFGLEEATVLNDHHGWDFNQIADAFEETFMNEEEN